MEPIFVVLGDMLDKMMETAVNGKDDAESADKSAKESAPTPSPQNSTESGDGETFFESKNK